LIKKLASLILGKNFKNDKNDVNEPKKYLNKRWTGLYWGKYFNRLSNGIVYN